MFLLKLTLFAQNILSTSFSTQTNSICCYVIPRHVRVDFNIMCFVNTIYHKIQDSLLHSLANMVASENQQILVFVVYVTCHNKT